MTARYAEKTSVSSSKSRTEIERTLARYGATGFAYGTQDNYALIGFQMKDRRVKFILPLPDREARSIVRDGRGSVRSLEKQQEAWEQAGRQRWRALALAIKAKLEAVASGITNFEEEFLAHIVLPNGQTVGKVMVPQIEHSYKHGKMPPLLGHDGDSR